MLEGKNCVCRVEESCDEVGLLKYNIVFYENNGFVVSSKDLYSISEVFNNMDDIIKDGSFIIGGLDLRYDKLKVEVNINCCM